MRRPSRFRSMGSRDALAERGPRAPLTRRGYTARGAFTLLEVILAVSLSVVLLSALYVALSLHYNQTRIGREVMDETIITRAVVSRISQDIACELPPIDPRIAAGATKAAASGSGGSGGGMSGTNGSGSGNTGTNANNNTSGYGGAGSNSNTTTAGNSTTSSSSASGTTVTSNLQVYGDQSNLVLTGRSVPQDLTMPPQSQQTMTSDLRRVTYWVVPGKGLARFEELQVTGGDVLTTPPTLPPVTDVSDSLIIAPEVTSIAFEYYDGTSWQLSWDGSTQDPSGNTTRPIGPPAAIAFTVTLAVPVQGPQKTRNVTYRHVVPVHTANNFLASVPGSSSSSATPVAGGSSKGP